MKVELNPWRRVMSVTLLPCSQRGDTFLLLKISFAAALTCFSFRMCGSRAPLDVYAFGSPEVQKNNAVERDLFSALLTIIYVFLLAQLRPYRNFYSPEQ